MPSLHMKAFGTKLPLPTVLFALHKLNFLLKMVIVTNITYFTTALCIFQNGSDLVLLPFLVDL